MEWGREGLQKGLQEAWQERPAEIQDRREYTVTMPYWQAAIPLLVLWVPFLAFMWVARQ